MTQTENGTTVVTVDCANRPGKLRHIWTSIMFDEINWSYSRRGKQILGFLNTQVRNRAIETPWYVRNHNTLTSGNCLGAPVSGSTNVYIEDEEGNPVYNWETIDKIYDSYVANGFRPIIEFGFMPYDLVPTEYQESSEFGKRDLGIEPYETGKLKYPPKDFNKWQDLIENLVRHLVERYGEDEVAEWYFEIWNEPDLTNYWRGTFEDFCKMYDYAGAGARKAFPRVKYGGPATTHFAPGYLKKFLEHCVSGRNYVTGETGSQIDFISFHSKGAAFSPRRTYGKPAPVQFPSLRDMAHDIKTCLEVVTSFPQLAGKPVLVDECDPAVGVLYGMYDNPNFEIWNTPYYPSFVAALVGSLLDIGEEVGRPIDFFSHASYYYEARRWFESNRTLFTNENVAQPIVAGLQMLSRLGDEKITLHTTDATDPLAETYSPQAAYIGGLASSTREGDGGDVEKISVLLWHHADDRTVTGEKEVSLDLANLPFEAGQRIRVKHWRIDHDHSNAYTVWQKMGRPEEPEDKQVALLKEAMQLTLLEPPFEEQTGADKHLTFSFKMPVHSLSLLELAPVF